MQDKKYFLGIDVGTYESKGVLVDLEGKVIASAVAAHGLENPKPNYFEHDAEKVWYGDVCKICQEILTTEGVEADQIAGVGMSALSSDCVPVDENCRPLRKAILYGIDARATEEMAILTEKWGEEMISREFGRPLVSSDVAPKILWIKRNEPEVYEKTYKFLTASSYLVAKLTGNYIVDRFLGLASFKPLYHQDSATINEDYIYDICRPDQLAEIMWTTDVAGKVTAQAAKDTGLAEGTPVIAGGDDSGAEAISCGVMTPGDMLIQMGSTVYMILCTDKLYDDDRIWRESFIVPNTFDISAGTNTAGSLTRWLRDNYYQDLVEAEQAGGPNAYAAMMEKMAEVPIGSRGLITLPYFAGERTPINDPKASGLILGLNLAHTKEDIMRSAFEGICFSIRQHFEIFAELGAEITEIMVTGGGVKNPVWMQMLADITGKTLKTPEVTTGASYGDALMAMIGTGYKRDFAEARKLIASGKTYEPCKENTEKYTPYYQLFNQLYEANKPYMHELHGLENK